MPSPDAAVIVLAGVGLFAAFVNGALGYGFSSLTVPIALVFYANRILNPAVVVIEIFINLYVLVINTQAFVLSGNEYFPSCSGSCLASPLALQFLPRSSLAGSNWRPTR